MDGQWTITIAPLAGLVFAVLTQIMVVHVSMGKVGASIMIGILGGLAATLAVIALGCAETPHATGGFIDTWLLGVATYLALAFGFWAFLNLEYHLDAYPDIARASSRWWTYGIFRHGGVLYSGRTPASAAGKAQKSRPDKA